MGGMVYYELCNSIKNCAVLYLLSSSLLFVENLGLMQLLVVGWGIQEFINK